MQTDNVLGEAVQEHLRALKIETPLRYKAQKDLEKNTAENVQQILLNLGLDLADDSLAETPIRVAKMFHREIFGGLNYSSFPKCTTVENKFEMDELVVSRGSVLRSTCEHHLQPIYGKCHIAYIPKLKVLGLSKMPRVANFFAARPQVQERLTLQIHAALTYILETDDVAVVIEAEHYCMRMRGVKDACADTVTSRMTGRFRSVPSLREEFLMLIRKG